MVTIGVFPFQGKTHMVEPGIEPGTSWLVVRNSDHQATRLVVSKVSYLISTKEIHRSYDMDVGNGYKHLWV